MTEQPSDPYPADAFEQEREALWAWWRAAGGQNASRAEFDARFDAELAAMRQEEAARGR